MNEKKVLEKARKVLNSKGTNFTQIRSNEGVMITDPLYPLILREHWKGILIEPVPRIFEKLKKNYSGLSDLFFENVAISNTKKTSNFYVIDENAEFIKKNPFLVNEAGGPWGDLVGSLDRDHILRCKPFLSEKDIKAIQVKCVTFQDIIEKYQLKRVDVLHIDAEGHDGVILMSINFKTVKPNIIIFEYVNLTPTDYQACTNYLYSHGYSLIHNGQLDTVVGNLRPKIS